MGPEPKRPSAHATLLALSPKTLFILQFTAPLRRRLEEAFSGSSFAIDWVGLGAIELAILIVFGFARLGRIATLLDATIGIAYFTFCIGGPEGQTIGMHLTGIGVIDDERDQSPSYPKAPLRFFLVSTFMSVAMIPLAAMLYFAHFDEKRQMIHNKGGLGHRRWIFIDLAKWQPYEMSIPPVAELLRKATPTDPRGNSHRREPRPARLR